jgi:hypothetical protein
MTARLRVVEIQPLYQQIAAVEFSETTADALAARLAELVAANAAPATDLFMAAMYHASTGSIGAQTLLAAIQRRRIFG